MSDDERIARCTELARRVFDEELANRIWRWSFYILIAFCSAQLDCRLRELRDELREVRHALPTRPAEIERARESGR